jgi:hypothetical protein
MTVTEPYNSILATRAMIDHSDWAFTAGNEAVSNLCRQATDIEGPTYTSLNLLIG